MVSKIKKQKGYSFLEMSLIMACCLGLIGLSWAALKVDAKIKQSESLMWTSKTVDAMPLIFKDAMNKDRKVKKLSPDMWEVSEIFRMLDIKIYRDQQKVAWRLTYNVNGVIQQTKENQIQVTIRGFPQNDCENLKNYIVTKEGAFDLKINPGSIEYEGFCQYTTANTIVYQQKLAN